MTDELILANATLVLPGETLRGSVKITEGKIAQITSGSGVPKGALDLEGDYLCPGLVESITSSHA